MRKKGNISWSAALLMLAIIGAVFATACSSGGSRVTNSPKAPEETPLTISSSSEQQETTKDSGSQSGALQKESAKDSEGQSGIPQTESTEGNQAVGEQLDSVALPQTTAVYFRTRGGSQSDTLKTIVQSTTGEMLGSKFIAIERTSSALVVYSPETEETSIFHTYSSPSWAKHSKRPLTIDDRLYLETEWESGDLDVVEYNPQSLTRGSEGDKGLLQAAIIGDTRYSYDYPEYKGFLGYYGYLKFVKEPQSGGEPTERNLRHPDAYRDDPDFPFTLVAWGQNLYGIKTPRSDGDPVVIYKVDQSTGEPTRIATFPVSDKLSGNFHQIHLDNGHAYWAPVIKTGSTTVIQLWSYRLGDPTSKLRTTDLKVPSGGRPTSLYGFDVDDGHFVFTVKPDGDTTHQLLFYDEESKSITMADPGLAVNYAEIIHFGEPGATSTPTSATSTGSGTTSVAVPSANPTPTPLASASEYAASGPTPTLAMTPLAKPDASAFQLEVAV